MNAPSKWGGYAAAAAAAATCTLAGLAMRERFDIVNIAMVYLLAVVLIALRCSRGAALFSAALSVVAFDFLFVPPQGTLTVHDAQYLLTFAIMGGVALVVSGLIERSRRESAAHADAAIAAETERIRSTLLASVSHDLRTPLAVMAGASSSLAERGEQIPPAERAALARSIYSQARDMAEQVDKVLQMTRIELGAIVLEKDWVALPEIVATVLARLGERLAGHQVVLDLQAELPLAHVDAALIEQVLANLLENAGRHTPANTLVQLRARASQGELMVSVEDFGPGLEDRDIEQVFDKFYRRSAAGSDGAAGTGLGLSICRAIIGLHGGRIWAEQIPGGGTAFRFTLPLAPPPAPPTEATEGMSW